MTWLSRVLRNHNFGEVMNLDKWADNAKKVGLTGDTLVMAALAFALAYQALAVEPHLETIALGQLRTANAVEIISRVCATQGPLLRQDNHEHN